MPSYWWLGYALLGLALLTMIVISFTKRRIFLMKVELINMKLDDAEYHLENRVFDHPIWKGLPHLNVAGRIRAKLGLARADVDDALRCLNSGDAGATRLLESARLRLQIVESIIDSGILTCFMTGTERPALPKPTDRRETKERHLKLV